jgi:hypothetical protein
MPSQHYNSPGSSSEHELEYTVRAAEARVEGSHLDGISMLAGQAFTLVRGLIPFLTNCINSSQGCSCLTASESYFTPSNGFSIADTAGAAGRAHARAAPGDLLKPPPKLLGTGTGREGLGEISYRENGLRCITKDSACSRFILMSMPVQHLGTLVTF